MKHLLIALLFAATSAHATYCGPETPQFCPQPAAGAPTTGPSTSSAGAAAGAAATAGASGAASITTNADGSVSVGLPPGVRAASLPAIRCRGTSSASGWVWNFLSFGKSDTDAEGVCQAADLAAMLMSQCQNLTAHTVLSGALGRAYPGAQFPIPPDARNSATGRCESPVVTPTPKPTPAPEKQTPPAAEKITLRAGALFDTDSADLKPNGMVELARLAQRLEPQQIAVIGHTDNTASAAHNERLSLRRAQAVRAYLIMRGMDPTLITAEGRGLREPVADNTTALGRMANRRVEIIASGVMR